MRIEEATINKAARKQKNAQTQLAPKQKMGSKTYPQHKQKKILNYSSWYDCTSAAWATTKMTETKEVESNCEGYYLLGCNAV
jgi:hypothetical protein